MDLRKRKIDQKGLPGANLAAVAGLCVVAAGAVFPSVARAGNPAPAPYSAAYYAQSLQNSSATPAGTPNATKPTQTQAAPAAAQPSPPLPDRLAPLKLEPHQNRG